MSIDSLGLTLHDAASSDEDEMEDHGRGSGEWQVREEDLVRAFTATSEGSLDPEGSEPEPDAETGEAGFQSKPSRVSLLSPSSPLFLCHVPIGANHSYNRQYFKLLFSINIFRSFVLLCKVVLCFVDRRSCLTLEAAR